MGLISRLLGTDTAIKETSKTVNNVFDGISAGIDKAWFTDEEKSDVALKFAGLKLEILKTIASNFTAADALARRLLALFIVGFYLSGITAVGIIRCVESIPIEGQERLSLELFNMIHSQPPGYVTTVLFIYFGYFGVKSGINAAKNK